MKKESLKFYLDKIDVGENWRNNYSNFVPSFISEALKGESWDKWEKEKFNEFFERSNNQCVSSLKQGYFTKVEQVNLKNNWNEIAPCLQKIANDQYNPQFEEYEKLREIIRKYTNQDRRAATYRLAASIQPYNLCTIVNHDSLKALMRFLNKKVVNANFNISGNWFENSNQTLKFFITESGISEPYNLITYPWQLLEYFRGKDHVKDNDMSEQAENKVTELLKYKKQIILQGPPGTGKTRQAKLIAKDLLDLNSIAELEDNEQFKLIQFHPSYTYEDFVRGIASKPSEDGDGIIYEAENRVLAHFAAKAMKNYQLSRADAPTKEHVLNLDSFINYIIERLDLDGKYMISDKVYIYLTDDRRFKYKGDNWAAHPKGLNMNYSELEKIIELNLNSRQEINKNADLNALTRQHATYYQNVIELYKKFIEDFKSIEGLEKEALKNYVLVIDEINRANLSSVLGELIYALEYRGETVESMYEINGSKKITLPPNLFIIGTMNTADRSVGHIDYAIRRRFAFVDVPPQKLQNTDEIWFDIDGFEAVSALFNSLNVSNEFEINDVQLGHSYFIAKKKDAATESKRDYIFKVKMEHEVKPILLEYVKDGVLINKINQKDIKEYILAL